MGVLIWGFSLGAPYDPKAILPAWQSWLTLVIAAGTGWFSIVAAIGNMSPARQARYAAEKFYLRLVWGLGLVMFVLIVAIPFYVMVMTSSRPPALQPAEVLSADVSRTLHDASPSLGGRGFQISAMRNCHDLAFKAKYSCLNSEYHASNARS